MKALIVVDAQNDFMPGGSLAVPDADKIIPIVNDLVDKFDDRNWPVFYTRDAHPPGHGSFASAHGVDPFAAGMLSGQPQMFWPDHCVVDTDGFAIHKDIAMPIHDRQPIFVDKGMDPLHDSYSGFADAGGRATDLLRVFGLNGVTHRDQLIICGLATDYCVKATAIDGTKLGFPVTVVLDGCRGVADKTTVEAIYEMLAVGITVADHKRAIKL